MHIQPLAAALALSLCACVCTPAPDSIRPSAQLAQPALDAAERDAIPASRAESNAAIAVRDLDAALANLAVRYRTTWAGIAGHYDLDAVRAGFAEDFADPLFRGYVRTPDRIRVSRDGKWAAEHGRWTGRWQRPAGDAEFEGPYFATWQRTADGWRLHSEAFISRTCTGPACPATPPFDRAAAETAIGEARQASDAAHARGDTAAVAASFDDDYRLSPAGSPTHVSRDAVEAGLGAAFATPDTAALTYRPDGIVVARSGTWAGESGRWAQGAAAGTYFATWRLDGMRWRLYSEARVETDAG